MWQGMTAGPGADMVDEMLSFLPPSLPGGVSLDRVSTQAPWRAYTLRVRLADPAGWEDRPHGPLQVEIPVAMTWNAPFVVGTLALAVAVCLGLLLPNAAGSRSYGLLAAGLALCGVVLLTRARFAPAKPDPHSLAEAIVVVRAARWEGNSDQPEVGASRLGEEARIRDCLRTLARSGGTTRAQRRGGDGPHHDGFQKGGKILSLTDVTWRAQVEIRARDLDSDLERAAAAALREGVQPETRVDYAVAARNISLAREVATSAPRPLTWSWWRQWTSGADVETAWSALHQAEAALITVLPNDIVHARLPEIRANVNTALVADPRLTAYLKTLDDLEAPAQRGLTGEDRERLRGMTSASTGASDAAYSNIRNYRNWLLIVSAVVTGALLAVAVGHASDPNFLHIRAPKSTGAGIDVGEIEVAGAIGGLLMALFALIRLTVYAGPVALPLWQSLVRIPAGAAAGLVGALLMQGSIVNAVVAQDRSGLLGYAVLFGAAPEIILRLLDKKVNEATAAARPKSDPLKGVPNQPANSTSGERSG
jgi:hypothetical protein